MMDASTKKLLWRAAPGLIATVVILFCLFFAIIRCVRIVEAVTKADRIQCLEFNGPLLNACLANCKFTPKLSYTECSDFCKDTTCKRWMR